ncbi:MAG: hypothetical protein MUE73_09910, partial [Planctomycetes bacterium]|nr:hypothetical protein [Planctomycetota bacterium]
MRTLHPCRVEEKGSAFVLVTVFVLCAVAIVGAFFTTSLAKVHHVDLAAARSDALLAAEAGINAVASQVFRTYRSSTTWNRVAAVEELDGRLDEETRLRLPPTRIGSSHFEAEVRRVAGHGTEFADVEIVARGSNRYATRSVTAIIRYLSLPSAVFDHAYFINNFGWLWGSTITVNGSVRSNGDFSLRDATVNGDVYASESEELETVGAITGTVRFLPRDTYNASAPATARPTDPSATPEDLNGNGLLDPGEDRNGNELLDAFAFPDGYAGTCTRHEGEPAVEMPYLGEMEYYRRLALEKGGRISIAGRTIVTGVFGDTPGEGKDLVLVGTPLNPIGIDGPVVIDNDIALKGTITGQGTIYAGRNIHLLGDLVYASPPSWPKPMEDAGPVAGQNAGRDLVGLVARGSVILGNYTQSTWKSATSSYLKPPFTEPYIVDEADRDIGFVSFYDVEGRPRFHADYTAYDGGKKSGLNPTAITGLGDAGAWFQSPGGTTSRRFYESSFPDTFLSGLCSTEVRRVDGVIYTNHLLSGRIGRSAFNGTLVGRD